MMKNKGVNEVNGGNILRGKCTICERVRDANKAVDDLRGSISSKEPLFRSLETS